MNFCTTTQHVSKALEGVSFGVKTLSEGRRIDIAAKLAGQYEKLEKIRRESKSTIQAAQVALSRYQAIAEKSEADLQALTSDPDVSAAADIQKQIDTIQRNEIHLVYVRELLASVEGLTIDDKPATPETAISDGPMALYEEILAAVKVELGLCEDEAKN